MGAPGEQAVQVVQRCDASGIRGIQAGQNIRKRAVGCGRAILHPTLCRPGHLACSRPTMHYPLSGPSAAHHEVSQDLKRSPRDFFSFAGILCLLKAGLRVKQSNNKLQKERTSKEKTGDKLFS